MGNFNQFLIILPLNIWVGCGAAFFSALLEISRHKLIWKDSLMVIFLSVGLTGAFIEWFLLASAPLSCFAVGLIAGRSADSFLQSIDDTMPDFSKNIVKDVQLLIRNLIAKRFGFSLPKTEENPETQAKNITPQKEDVLPPVIAPKVANLPVRNQQKRRNKRKRR